MYIGYLRGLILRRRFLYILKPKSRICDIMNLRRASMKKCYVICDYLTAANKEKIVKTAGECGFEVTFYESSDEARGNITDAEVAYCIDSTLLKDMPQLRWCHDGFAGVEKFVASGVFDSGDVVLTNSSGAYGLTISEHIIMVTLMLMRRMPDYLQIIEERGWIQDLPIRSIQGSSVAVIGTGDIGRNTAGRFKALGAAKVTGFNRSGNRPDEFDEVYRLEEFDKACGADVLVLCVPGTADSKGLLSRERIAMLSGKTFVVNVGRGTVIDQEALTEALNNGRIAGAALDVMYPEPLPDDHPLWTAKNCIITPHISGDMGLPYTVDKTVEFFCENFGRYVRGEKLLHRVDISAGY